jgi:hypothetical protein
VLERKSIDPYPNQFPRVKRLEIRRRPTIHCSPELLLKNRFESFRIYIPNGAPKYFIADEQKPSSGGV